MIVETASNQLYFVAAFDNPNLSHVWRGLRVKRSNIGYTVVGKKEEMIRRAGCIEIKVK